MSADDVENFMLDVEPGDFGRKIVALAQCWTTARTGPPDQVAFTLAQSTDLTSITDADAAAATILRYSQSKDALSLVSSLAAGGALDVALGDFAQALVVAMTLPTEDAFDAATKSAFGILVGEVRAARTVST